ncbi:importin-4 isoform X2 [Ooceraea biroi]|uniref:importin-4 isoform X2 n=1 Tax=Ooceraea biroi TaxID=2015173 RepID=UPI0005BC01E4|nr:importin-4 isoform X2 [Ooceraea biroi]
MEAALVNLLVSDNATIQEATVALKKLLKDPESIKTLCEIIVSSQNAEVRQYAAVLLRRRYCKDVNWKKLPESIRTDFKKVILQALVNEKEKFVKNSIAQLIGIIIKYELPTNNWPEIIDFVQQSITSEHWETKELGTYTLASMTEVTPEPYSSHGAALAMLLFQTLNNPHLDLKGPIAYNILKTLRHLVPLVEHDTAMQNTYTQMMPRIITTIQVFTEYNQPYAIESFELLDELCENVNTVITPHIKSLVNLCLTMAANKSIEPNTKIKAINFIGWLARIKKKALVKHKLIEPIVNMLFVVMTMPPENDGEDDINAENENSVLTCATQTLDLLALHLPPEKLIPHLSTDVYAKKASYVAMAVLAEGCAEYICSKYLESFLRCICEGIKDSALMVRNAALYALGQFSEHLQPDISRYSSELLPVLFDYLNQVCSYIKQTKKEPHSLSRMFYALEMFCQNLDDSILPYLPTLMERLFEILSADMPMRVRELALSAVSAAASASMEHMLPYFDAIIAILDSYLAAEPTEETMSLQVQAIDTLGVVARSIGKQHFAPLAARTLNLGMKLLKNTEDPDLRKAVYGLLAAISTVTKKDMAAALPDIVEYMIMSIRSSEGIVMHFKEDNTALGVYDNLSESDDENEEEDIEHTDNEDDDDDVEGYSVENSYIEEKEEAVIALKEIAENTEEAFMPYLERAFEEIFTVIDYPQEDIRKASIEALCQFCVNFSKIDSNDGKTALSRALSILIPKLAQLIKLDEEQTVAICGLDAYATLLSEIESNVFEDDGRKDAVMSRVMDVFTGKTACQDQEEVEGDNIEAEQDILLVESAGGVLCNLGRVIAPESFAYYFQTVLPLLLKRLKGGTEGQRSFVTGTIAECFQGLRHTTGAFVPQLLPIFLQTAQDSSSEVRNNSFFGIGELVLHAKEAAYPHYPEILQLLSCAIAKETSANARDNVVGAIARLIITNYSNMPLEQVFPVFVQQLPLKEDLQENKVVFKSILTLYQAGLAILKPHITILLKVAFSVLHEEKIKDDNETKNLVIEFIKSAQRDFPNDWNALYNELPQEIATNMQQIFA